MIRRGWAIGVCGAAILAVAGDLGLGRVEESYLDLFEIRDRIVVTSAGGASTLEDGTTITAARDDFRKRHGALSRELDQIKRDALSADDRRALDVMQRALRTNLGPSSVEEPSEEGNEGGCGFDAAAVVKKAGLAGLQEAMYSCYGRTAEAIPFEGRTYARLTILEKMGKEGDPARRKALFLALEPLFRSINGDGGLTSPYRLMLPLSAAEWAKDGSPIDANLKALGVEREQLESWLVSILEAWRGLVAQAPVEPWDYDYVHGAAARALAEKVPLGRLMPINDRVYAELGAPLEKLGVRYDTAPRPGKTPVAFCDFGARPRLRNGVWTTGRPSVFATYEAGGLGNLSELIHESGHAVHIAAIRTRPAYADWPDSDALTEALADVFALEMYEPAWQQRYFGAAASLADNLRAKYSGIVFDVAWALLEWRLHRDPRADPNTVWTDIAARYLRIKPHAEKSWWARRGQLVNSPGYMMNYALGAILVADIRAAARQARGHLMNDSGYYSWISERLYRFGLERPSGEVVREFLGRSLSPAALIADMRRARMLAPP